MCRYATALIYKFSLDSRLITCVLPLILSLSYCEFRHVLVILCVCTVRFTLFHADLLRVHRWNKFVLLSYVALIYFFIPNTYEIKLFACPGQLFFSYFPLTTRHALCFPFIIAYLKNFQWLSERVSNTLVGLLTLRVPSPGWVSILLFNFFSLQF